MPGGFPEFCQSNLPIIYGLYGLAFFVTGIAVWLASGRASNLALNRALPFLAAFGLAHGTHEWIEMFGLMLPSTPNSGPPAVIEAVNLALLAGSFVCLIEFAVRLLRLLEPDRYDSWAVLTWLFTALFLSALIGYGVWAYSGDESLFWRVADILARYLLGLSGAALAAWAMLVQRRALVREGYAQFSRDTIGAALAFAWYGGLQLVAAPTPYFPSSLLNTSTFQDFTGIPVQLFRAVVGALSAFFIIRVMHVFETESARRLDTANGERFAAQEKAARELTALYETCRSLGTTLDLNLLLNESLERIVTLVEPVCAGMILLSDEGEQSLLLRAHYHRGALEPPAFGAQARELAQRAGDTKQLAYGSTPDGVAVLAVPLLSGDNFIGALCVAQDGAFSNLAVLQTLARQLVIAIENARLYQEVQQKEVLRGQLLERVVAAQEQERKRLARDLHDQTGQRLTALALGISSVDEVLDKNPGLAHERLKELEQLGTGAIDDLRQFVSDLRPSLLDDLGLVAALRQMVKQTAARSGVEITFALTGQRRRVRSEIETVLYRIAQEALNNTVRHAHATRASVALQFGAEALTLNVVDNGRGFTPVSVLKAQAQVRAWGLLGMQERVELVGGKLEIESAPGRGTRLAAEVPLEAAEVEFVHSTVAG